MGSTFSFDDIFKTSFMDKIANVSITDIVISFLVAGIVSAFIYFIYKYTFSGVMYSRSFNLSLVCLALLTNLVIQAITSNVILSLGMVGALSIVRFRTAIKDPMDLVFLFWSIGVGIITGAGAAFYILAGIGSLLIGLLLFLFNIKKVVETPYLLIVSSSDSKIEEKILNIVKTNFKAYKLKSKIVSQSSGVEWIYEIRGKGTSTQFLDEISSISGVVNSSMVSYNGEYTT